MTPTLRRLLVVALSAAAAPAARGADVFSPGDLTRPHASLSGLENCTKCHPRGEQLSQQQCLDCHQELSARVSAGKGFHGRIPEKDRDCWTCHHEHQGRDFALVDWGRGGQKRFDHARVGAPLRGKHDQVACQRCHDPRLVQDPRVRELLARQPSRRTFLGAPAMASCASCHSDEHRGQLGADCGRCHGDGAWKPAPGFDHAKTAYALTGKHARVACERCHPPVQDGGKDHGALTPPVSPNRYSRYRPVAHAACLDCHHDVHQGRFGTSCARCHATDDWRRIVSGALVERAFHQKTRYPLEGAHASVGCAACHGPFAGEPARFRPLAFQACTDCHADAHLGQLARGPSGLLSCERCHDVNGYLPVKFGLEEHQRLPFKLEGAHRVVACSGCHPREPALAARLPKETRAELERRRRPVRISLAVYAIAGDLGRCETCHTDPHAGQLRRPRGCSACHTVDSFKEVRFDHQRESRFPLLGAHARVACASCHRAETTPALPPSQPSPLRGEGRGGGPLGPVVRYRPLERACVGCHADPHLGQFAVRTASAAAPGGPGAAAAQVDCGRCHGTEDWKRTLFRHEPPFTDYALTGKHRDVACEKCHPAVKVAAEATVRRYRPLPRSCNGCHADFHKGAFQGFDPGRSRP